MTRTFSPAQAKSAACRLVILISGRGSNMAALIKACQAGTLPVEIVAVISNRSQAYGLRVAAEAGIPTAVVERSDFANTDDAGRRDFDTALRAAVDEYNADLIALAGFMHILSADFTLHYAGRLLNIHPSLLPAFTGLNTHARALAAGVRIHGCSVHFVTPELDHGPIVIQAAVPVLPDDDVEQLAARVLSAEHIIYPRAVRWFAEGSLSISSAGKVHLACSGSISKQPVDDDGAEEIRLVTPSAY